jgi:hypothetical protein
MCARSSRTVETEKREFIVVKALSAGQNMHIAEEYARTVGRQPPTIQYPPTPPYAPPGEPGHHGHLILPDLGSPDEGSIADIEYRSMLEKRSDGGEKSPVTEKTESRGETISEGKKIASTDPSGTKKETQNPPIRDNPLNSVF